MKKFFITLAMVLLGLFAGVSTVWATNMSGMTDDEALTQAFWARMTAKPATTTLGSGLVFVSEDDHAEEPGEGNYKSVHSKEGWSDIYLASSLISATVDFKVYAKANAGSYFTGWSFTDGYTDLGVGSGTYAAIKVNPSPKKGKANILDYTVYAAFEQVKLKSYEVSGGNTMDPSNPTCTQTVTFRAETPGFRALNSADDVKHFKLPVITPKAGTAGTWTTSITEWNTSNISLYGEYAEIRVPVTFTAPNSDPAEYGAELVLETFAGVKMKVYLSARMTGGAYQAIRYNKSKVQQETGDFATLLTNAEADDIIKLNSNYSSAVSINKNITLDLNGYTLSNTLTISGGNVTIAYSPYGGSATSLNVTGGKAILNGGTFGTLTIGANATVEQNGATITDAATNNGTLTTTNGEFQAGLTSTKTLIVNGGTFNGATAIQVTGGTASIKRGTISGTQYGVLTNGGSATIEKLAVISGGTKALNNVNGTLTVNNGKFADPSKFAIGEITFKSAYFKSDASDLATTYTKQQWRNTAGPEFREGYKYFVGDQEAAQASNVSVCRIGKTSYASLDEALAYANNHLSEEVIIIMENDYTLKAGYYTIPANATLIVPMSDDQETANPVVPRETDLGSTPKSFRRLTLESGVNMTVLGTVEVTGMQHGSGEQMGVPGGNYGHLILKPGSHVTLSSGSVLRAWGFVTGDGTTDADGNYLSGEIDARRGATVREMFQMGDWKGGDISFTIAMEMPDPSMPNYRDLTHLFPIYTYFIQNVESPVKYHPGSALICATSVNVQRSINAYANDIKVVGKDGEAAMFLMDEMADAENTWVRKYYDAKKDQQVYEVNSGAKLGSVVIDLGEVPGTMFGGGGTFNIQLDSRKFVLPLTNNFKIHLLSGYMEFTQSTSCLPGMEVEVDKESEVALVNNRTPGVAQGALYLYDADQWSFTNPDNGKTGGYVGNSGKFGAIVRYSATLDRQPTVRDIRSPEAIGDAKLIVHGTFRSGEDCSVYTTWAKDLSTMGLAENGTGGASIISTNEDAGTFIFDADAPHFDGVRFEGEDIVGFGPNVIFNYDHNDYNLAGYPLQIPTVLNPDTLISVFGFELCTLAKLKNADGTFVETDSTKAGTSYCYMNDRWTLMEVAEENECFMKDNYGTFYAKPQEYVAVNATWDGDKMVGNDDHTYSDKDGAGRLFILMDNCQWWEVEKKDNLYHCIHPNNDTYYYWQGETPDPYNPAVMIPAHWEEQRFTITWLNWNGDTIKSYTYDPNTGEPEEVPYSVTYGTQAEFLGSNPTREPNIDYTYDFTGWTPALGKVTSDVTYTATYSKQPRKYTIIFTTEGGVEIERQFLTHNELPVCENVPTKTGFTLQWEPALAAVTGDATYRATWLEEPPTEYEITFVDYNGTTVLKQGNVAVGTIPIAPTFEDGILAGSTGKPATSEFTYVFDHWSPAVEEVTQAMTYTAVYREEAKTYTVTFKNEDNSVIETRQYHYGETPVCMNQPTKENTAEFTYALRWTPQIQTVMADAEYTAVFDATTNKYSVTLQCSPSGAAVLSGGGLYNYNESVTLTATANAGYVFRGWSDNQGGQNITRQIAITKDVLLVANFECPTCDNVTIQWLDYDGTELKTVSQAKGTATTYTGKTPTRPATSTTTYTFDGWSTTSGGDLVYKNGMTPKAAEGGATYYAHYAVQQIPNLEVHAGATVNLTAPVEYNDLVLVSNGTSSGQLFGADDFLSLTGNAYFEFVVNATARLWYAFAVPWQVDAATGVSVNGHTLQLGKDFDIIYYDGARRAAVGPQRTWNYVANGEALQPGKLYMIVLMSDASAIRFAKKADTPYFTNSTSVSTYASETGSDTDANWNGIANPALFHAFVNAGATLGQVYQPASETYTPIVMEETKFVVGQAVFVQAPADKSIVVSSGASYAPRRYMKAETTETTKFEVRIAPINTDYTDRVFVQLNEEKTQDIYTVGMDLQKMGVSSKVAQMWINRYDTKLCLNTMAPIEAQVDYPLGIIVPEAGKYTISIKYTANDNSQADLFLTLDGEPIWNLSQNAYTVKLEQGTTSRYGLRTVSKAPQTTTDIEPIWMDPEGNAIKAAKVLINNHVYIIRDGKLYTITGSLVR